MIKTKTIKTKVPNELNFSGAACHAADKGFSDARIRALGRWKSDAFKVYIRSDTLPGANSGAPNENIVQNHLNIALVNVF